MGFHGERPDVTSKPIGAFADSCGGWQRGAGNEEGGPGLLFTPLKLGSGEDARQELGNLADQAVARLGAEQRGGRNAVAAACVVDSAASPPAGTPRQTTPPGRGRGSE